MSDIAVVALALLGTMLLSIGLVGIIYFSYKIYHKKDIS
jgi:hypothetical protein